MLKYLYVVKGYLWYHLVALRHNHSYKGETKQDYDNNPKYYYISTLDCFNEVIYMESGNGFSYQSQRQLNGRMDYELMGRLRWRKC